MSDESTGLSQEQVAQRAGCGVATVGRYARAGWLTRLPNGRLSPAAVGEARARLENDGRAPTKAATYRESVLADLLAAIARWPAKGHTLAQAVELVRLSILHADLSDPRGLGAALEQAIERIADTKARRLLFDDTTTRGPSAETK